jgi:predicted nucleic acid-binding protein
MAKELMADLGRGPVGLDTAIFIYFIEEHPRFLPLVEPLFREADKGRRELVTSALTLSEVLVVPYRSGDYLLAKRYEALLTQSRGVHIAEISRDHLRAAAQLRAATGVKTPDALQLVAAMSAGCSAFLTNDRDLPALSGLRILQLSSYNLLSG